MCTPTCSFAPAAISLLNQTEALVAIDVNSSRATREPQPRTPRSKPISKRPKRSRAARLRDLAGLIVIDFIDMTKAANTIVSSSGG